MSLLSHPSWSRYVSYLEPHDDHTLRLKAPADVEATALTIRMPCVMCGRRCNPFRKDGKKILYYGTCIDHRSDSEIRLLGELL